VSLIGKEGHSAIKPQDVLSRLEAAVVLRDNLVAALGRVLLICLDDDARVPFQSVHDAVRSRRVAVYELLRMLPAFRKKPPPQQLHKFLRTLERVDSRFVSGYASLCVNVYRKIEAVLTKGRFLVDMLLNVDAKVIDSVSRDRRRDGTLPLSLQEGIDFLLRAARKDDRIMNLRTVSAVLLNYPAYDLTDPEVHGAMRFVARRMRERSRPEDPLLRDARQHRNAEDLLRAVLERLEVDELTSDATKEASSLLLQSLGEKSYPPAPSWKHDLKKLLTLTSDRYPVPITAVAGYLVDHLDDSYLHDLDIGFFETGDHARLQVLSRLYGRPGLRHLRKPLSLLMTFVSQRLMSDAGHEYTTPINFCEVNDYLDSFDTPCLQDGIRDAMNTMRSHLSEHLPWDYAFRDRRTSDSPWELTLTSLVHLRSVPMNRSQAIAIDNFVYKSRSLIGKPGPLYSSGIIFQRPDTMDVEIDLYSLLTQIPNVFKSKRFVPLLNFLSKPNILDVLGYGFNKFDHETARDLLLALLKRALLLVKCNESLFGALQKARIYLEEPLLINLYATKELQILPKYLPGIENDSRYLPLKILFGKRKLFEYLKPTFNLAGLHTPMERLLLILRAVSLEVTEPETFDALNFALERLKGSPLPVRTFDHADFVYLIRQLLPRNETYQTEIPMSPVYANISDWNVRVSGSPESVLVRALSYPVKSIASDARLATLVRRAKEILEEKERYLDTNSLKKRTLEALLEQLPSSVHAKPVSFLLRKPDLMAFVPNLNLTALEKVSERDPRYALIMLLKNLTKSREICADKLMLNHIKVTLSCLKHQNAPRASIGVYLTRTLQHPNDVLYKPLLREMKQLSVTIPLDERRDWLKIYLQRLIAQSKTERLKEAATMALREVTMTCERRSSNELRIDGRKLEEAASLLPTEAFAKPLRQLLTPDWMYNILAEDLGNVVNSLNNEELLLTILRYAKQRADVASSPVLMKAIFRTVTRLKRCRTNVQLLRSAVADVMAAVYDPVKSLLASRDLNNLRIVIPRGEPATKSLLELLQHLLLHPAITRNNGKISSLLRTVRQDLLVFGKNVELLAVLDDVGIPYISELAPIRLFLHRTDVIRQFGQTVLAIADPTERYCALLDILQKRGQADKDARFLHSLSLLRNTKLDEGRCASTLVSDLRDVASAIPRHVRKKFKRIEHLFNNDILSKLTSDNEIVESKTPLTTLLHKIADLPVVADDYIATKELKKMYNEVQLLDNRSIITGFQLRPLLLVLQEIQQINVDFVNSILGSELSSFLDMAEFANLTNNNIEILKSLVDYLLTKESAYVDDNVRKHLRSFKSAMAITLGSNTSDLRLTDADWEEILASMPHREMFTPVQRLLQSKKVLAYTLHYEDTNWRLRPISTEKLLHLLLTLENDNIGDKEVHGSLRRMRLDLGNVLNLITEENVAQMRDLLMYLESGHDLSALRIFLDRDNLIRYLPLNFRYDKYDTPIDAFIAVLHNLLKVSGLKRNAFLCKAMKIAKKILCKLRSKSILVNELPCVKDLEFVNLFNVSGTRLHKFLNPKKLSSLLPKSFIFKHGMTFKAKASHLLRHLLKLKTDVRSELEKLLRQVIAYPDVPVISKNDLVPLLNAFPVHKRHIRKCIELVKSYLKPSKLIRLLPGNFNIKQIRNANAALRNVLSLLRDTLGCAKNAKLEKALHVLLCELDKINYSSNAVAQKRTDETIDHVDNEIMSVLNEISFKQYKLIGITPANVISSLPPSFQLTKHKTRKLQLLAILDAISKNNMYRSSIKLREIVSKMPDVPIVNDTEIEKLLLWLPLDTVDATQLVKSCKVAMLMPYLPIYFNLNSGESRKSKIAEILHYCELANPKSIGKQVFNNVKVLLKRAPDFDVSRDQVEILLGSIPCINFSSMRPLLRFLSKRDVTPLLPWNLDLYETSRTFKLRILDLLAALRGVKDLRNDRMLSALESLETNAKSLPDAVTVTSDYLAALKSSKRFDIKPCADYREFVTKPDNLIKIMPPTYRFRLASWNPDDVDAEWSTITRLSMLFLRDVRVNGFVKDALEACRDNVYRNDKDRIVHYLNSQINQVVFEQASVPLRLYVLGHAETFSSLIDNVNRGFLRGTTSQCARLLLREFIRRSRSTGRAEVSKSLIDSMDIFLHDHMIVRRPDTPSYYEVDLAIREIPSGDEYDDARLLMKCADVRTLIMKRNLSADGTTKQLLLDMLRLALKSEIEEKTRQSVKSLELQLEQAIREEEADHVLKQMRDYRYHVSKMKPIRAYLVHAGLQKILGNDYHVRHPLYRDRLLALNNVLLTATNLTSDLLAASSYLNKVLRNKMKIKHVIPSTVDAIDVQTLLSALPRTKDEKIIRGIVRFFSKPDLLRKLNLPKDPFEYETKYRLLQAMLNVGMGLESVQEDPAQREAIEYYSDKILTTAHGAQPIELKSTRRNFNVNVDMYGVLRAVDYTKANLTDALRLVTFLEQNPMHTMGFSHVAYATRGAYLKMLLEHLANASEVPDDVKRSITSLTAAVRLDGPGDEAVDLDDVVEDVVVDARTFRKFLNASHADADADADASFASNASRLDLLHTFRKKNGDSAVDNTFDSVSSKGFLGQSDKRLSKSLTASSGLAKALPGERVGAENQNRDNGSIKEPKFDATPSVIPKSLDIRYGVTEKTRRRKSRAGRSSKADTRKISKISHASSKVNKKMIKVHPISSASGRLKKSSHLHETHRKRVFRKPPPRSNLVSVSLLFNQSIGKVYERNG